MREMNENIGWRNVATGEPERVQEVLAQLGSNIEVDGAMLIDRKGKIFARVGSSELADGLMGHLLHRWLDNGSRDPLEPFDEDVFDYHGKKVLSSLVVDDMLLLVALEKSAFLCLFQLEIEHARHRLTKLVKFQGSS